MTDSDDLPERGVAMPDMPALDRIRAKFPDAPAPIEQAGPLPSVAEIEESERVARWHAAVPRRFWDARLADIDPGAPWRALLDQWAEDETPGNLLLFGNVGVGKTHSAIAACRTHSFFGADLAVWPSGELIDALDWRRPESAQTMAAVMAVDLLVVDDLGTERPNDWVVERLYAIVNRRWLECRPTVATTNLEPPALQQAVGERTYSRLADDSLAIEIPGDTDRRRS